MQMSDSREGRARCKRLSQVAALIPEPPGFAVARRAKKPNSKKNGEARADWAAEQLRAFDSQEKGD